MTAHTVAINTDPASFKGIPERYYGAATDPQGHEIRFTNYFMTLDGKPRFMVMGEFEFSRVEAWQWEDELIKLKMMGVNVISFYVYWIHHEEKRGQWDFTGQRDLRRFVQLCAKHGLWCVARIGPFVHSETRNGGLPDWLYGQPFEVRENDPEFLKVVDDYYAHVGRQLRGLMYKDGGPIIATQLDNEYEHSSAPWECTTGAANEWVNTGSSGVAYINALKKLALKHGFDTPFYTATAWGDAVTGDSAVPLWGGYPYRPWLFYGPNSGEHPATLEYQYQNFHSSTDMAASMYDMFDTNYKPEDYPYACCEMGGGMFCSYDYRFILPMKSVDAMANIKTASGCNFLGYYIIKGGTNPKRDGGFTNEGQCPKIQYDFQAPLGEFAQTRESYDRLKALHMFAHSFESELVPMLPMLPAGQNRIDPKDTQSLRWSVRASGHSGFVFIDNFQDHVDMPARSGETIRIEFSDGAEPVTFNNIGIAANENCVLPFNMNMGSARLISATAQPVTRIATVGGAQAYVFLKPEGMPDVRFAFEPGVVTSQGSNEYCCDPAASIERFSITGGTTVIVLDRAHADKLFVVDRPDGAQALIIAQGAIIPDDNGLRFETTEAASDVLAWPADALAGSGMEPDRIENSGFGVYAVGGARDSSVTGSTAATLDTRVELVRRSKTRWTVSVSPSLIAALESGRIKNAWLDVDYVGDVGQAFFDGDMIHDNFANGAVWQIGLHEFTRQLAAGPLTLYITPIKEGVTVDVNSPMAARSESAEKETSEILSVGITPVYEYTLKRWR
ncbi:beta-galactosidase [Bifidobacterium goeldii]|uniref:Beta-galactosidase n=1 Tax=Bifidobacterium goeldii TaxID=2306975 RepID=A0A430FKZ0_9BIFI|nr:beta-galactosidase [Bifidobacterium goeldii]RSX53575.1 beta-galactosidase [Bifidobacterium goeldii]